MEKTIKDRNSFTFYKSFYDAIKELPEKNQNELYRIIIEYSFTEKLPETLEGINATVWTLIKPFLSSNISKFKNGVKLKESKAEANDKQNGSKTEGNKEIDIEKEKELAKAFENIYKLYPKKERRKEAYKHFKASVKTDADLVNIQKAIHNYLELKKDVPIKYLMQAGTFFNNWTDYIDVIVDNRKSSSASLLGL